MIQFSATKLARRATNRRTGRILIRETVPRATDAYTLARIYIEVVNTWSTALKRRLLPAYGSSITRQKPANIILDSVEETSGVLSDIADEINRLIVTLTPSLRKWVVQVEGWHRESWIRNLLVPTKVDLSTLIHLDDVEETLEAVLQRNVALIKSVSDQVRDRVGQSVFSGFQQNKPVREVAKEINNAVQLGGKRSRRIAQDQTQKLAVALDVERRTQAGFSKYIWRWSHKQNPREWHKARDGKVFLNSDPRIPSGDGVGEPPYCGCRASVFIDLEE